MKTNDKTAAKCSWKNAILLAITALALLASPGVALAADCLPQTTWTLQGAGSWFTSGNWSNGVPDSGTAALINNGGTAQITASLPVANACSLTLGPNAGDSGKVSVSIGTLDVTTGVVVGNHGTGSLSVSTGGTLTGGDMSVGGTAATDGTGLLTVTDTSTVTAASVGVNLTGTLTGNGTVSTTSGVTIDGTLEPSGGTLSITGNGNLTLDSSATTLSNVVPASADNVDVVTAGASLSGKLVVTMTGNTFTPGTTYTLLRAGGGRINDSRFSSTSIKYAPPSQCFTPKITYDANHVYLYLEPCT